MIYLQPWPFIKSRDLVILSGRVCIKNSPIDVLLEFMITEFVGGYPLQRFCLCSMHTPWNENLILIKQDLIQNINSKLSLNLDPFLGWGETRSDASRKVLNQVGGKIWKTKDCKDIWESRVNLYRQVCFGDGTHGPCLGKFMV